MSTDNEEDPIEEATALMDEIESLLEDARMTTEDLIGESGSLSALRSARNSLAWFS